jgi:hypothetical protein
MEAIKLSYVSDATGNPVEYEVGRNCISITEHYAAGEGDRWYYDVELVNERVLRIFVFGSMNVLFKK